MLITMGCSDQWPIVPGVKRDEWPLEDPKAKTAYLRSFADEPSSKIVQCGKPAPTRS